MNNIRVEADDNMPAARLAEFSASSQELIMSLTALGEIHPVIRNGEVRILWNDLVPWTSYGTDPRESGGF